MGIVRFPATRASKPMSATIIESIASGAYYTVVEVTSGSGFLNRLITTNSYSSTGNITEFRVTIDGIAQSFYPPSGLSAYQVDEFEVFSSARFNFSLKVEVKNGTGSTYSIMGGCDYTLEI